MITGYNTEIEHQGSVFHVQTEDKGLNNPYVETLIYCGGGEIISSVRTPYADMVAAGQYSEAEVQRIMERQHQAQLREIRNGKFDSGELMPFGYNIVTTRPFNDVVLGFLQEEAAAGAIKLKMLDWQVLYAGTRPTLRMNVVDPLSQAPVPAARVTVVLESKGGVPVELFSGDTDGDGFVEASFQVPAPAGPAAELVCRVVCGEAEDVFRQRVKKAEPTSAVPA